MVRALAISAAMVVAAPAVAQSPTAELAWLTGSWRGEGQMFGNTSSATLEVRPALGGRFLELRYQAGRFEGRAFYRAEGDGRWQAHWFDNRGISFPIRGAATAEWGSPETERGRTVYRLLPDGGLELSDSVRTRDGSWRDFARHTLRRSD